MKQLIALAFLLISIEAVAHPDSFMPDLSRGISSLSVIDSGNIKITYILNQLAQEPNKSDDIQILEIGQKLSKYYSYNIFRVDSLRTDVLKQNPNAQGVPGYGRLNFDKLFWSDYYKDYATNEISEYAYMPRNIPNYQYSENIDFDWQIQEDTRMIASYLCQRATCSFRGKNYTAWFSPDIPISNGPWKFGGLPGLILKVYDDRNDYVFECIGIENRETRFPITSYYDHRDYKKIERKKLLKLWGDIFDHYCQIIGMTPDLFKKSKSPYKPIELE
ncbi:hypothetical protein AGMMS4957_08060 [Bacteroidia bacterium]|nr:hypothetical protein AGMMS4957_08060 [Bacteroidia bacterium]